MDLVAELVPKVPRSGPVLPLPRASPGFLKTPSIMTAISTNQKKCLTTGSLQWKAPFTLTAFPIAVGCGGMIHEYFLLFS